MIQKRVTNERQVVIDLNELTELKFFSLSNYKQIRTPFGFIDESGAISKKDDPFFGIGIYKIQRPSLLYRKLRSIRSSFNFYEEIKWNKLSYVTLKIAKEFIRASLTQEQSQFNAIIIPKTDPAFDIDIYFDGDIFQMYKKFLVELIKNNINEIEIMTIIADDFFTPSDSKYDKGILDSFEGGVRAIINDHFKRLAMTGMCQINSKANDCLQLVDILIGCCVCDSKITKGYIDLNNLSKTQEIKLELLQYVKILSGIELSDSLLSSKNRQLKIKLFNPSKKNKNGSSSIEATPVH